MDITKEGIQSIITFLSQRDCAVLDKNSVVSYFDGKRATAIVVFGNDLPQVAEAGCRAWLAGLGDWLVFCGGRGHSTDILINRMEMDSRYQKCDKKDSEAGLFGEIAMKLYGIPKEKILLEVCSTNCGANAANAVTLMKQKGISTERIILMQDPLMQRRSKMSMLKVSPESQILAFAPFIPMCDDTLTPIETEGTVWTRERFMELLLGEIRRLRDDESGYGPQGAGFIGHVDIPPIVEAIWNSLFLSEESARARC